MEEQELTEFCDEKGLKKLNEKSIRIGISLVSVKAVQRKRTEIHIQLNDWGPADKIIFCLQNNHYRLVKGDMISMAWSSEPIYVCS